jgi:hypothetical protein
MAICTLGYYLPKPDASTLIVTSNGFQNQPSNTNINLVPTKLEMERLQLFKKLEQLHHFNRRPSNQSIFIPNMEPIEPITRQDQHCLTRNHIQTRHMINEINTLSS